MSLIPCTGINVAGGTNSKSGLPTSSIPFGIEKQNLKTTMALTQKHIPLAEQMRPKTLSDFVGQEEIVGPGTLLRRLIEQDEVRSLIFWGPTGVGKTSIASIIAEQTGSYFVPISAVSSGKSDLIKIIKEAELRLHNSQKTILFI